MKYNEHPEVEIPEWLQGAGWEDMSYHNDAMPRSEWRPIPENEYPMIRVWVNYENPEDREDQCPSRYIVSALYSDADQEETKADYEGDDAEGAQHAILKTTFEMGSRQFEKQKPATR